MIKYLESGTSMFSSERKVITGEWKIKSVSEFDQLLTDVDSLLIAENFNWRNYTIETKLQMPDCDVFCGGIAFGLDNDLTGTLFYLSNPSDAGMAKLQKNGEEEVLLTITGRLIKRGSRSG